MLGEKADQLCQAGSRAIGYRIDHRDRRLADSQASLVCLLGPSIGCMAQTKQTKDGPWAIEMGNGVEPDLRIDDVKVALTI